MQHTLVAVFEKLGDAQNAMTDLLVAGFARQDMRLSEDGSPAPAAASGTAAHTGGEGSITASIKHFFSELFGSAEHAHARKYSDAIARGHHVLTLTVADEPAAERAADIIERHGPIDVDENAGRWSGAPPGAAAGAGAQQQARPMSQQQGGQGSQQRADSGAQAREIPIASGEIRRREFRRGGVRVYTTELVVDQLSAGEDSDYRGHWSSHYAGSGDDYDDYEPAYRYGSSMARSDAYRGRPWDEAEPGLKSEWEARHPGSAWEKFKAAVRHGWDKITS